MKRRVALLFTSALLVGVLVLWVRSYRRVDMLGHAQPGRHSVIWTREGRLYLDTVGDDHVSLWPRSDRSPAGGGGASGVNASGMGWSFSTGLLEPNQFHPYDDPVVRPRTRRFLGFIHLEIPPLVPYTRRFVGVGIPLWSLALLLSIPPALHLLGALRRRRRRLARHCPHCNYDLRAHTAAADRCPECGTPINHTDAPTPSPTYSGERAGERGERRAES